jgi:hypothetical protein
MRIAHISLLAVLIAPTYSSQAGAQQPAGCADLPGFRALDFWVGEWDVTSGGSRVGANRIEKILGGCAIMEHWSGAAGGDGKSLFYFNHVTGDWKQVWVTSVATVPGGLKEKTLLPPRGDGALQFQGVVQLADGRRFLDRTTLTPLPDGRVRQVIEISADSGATWQARFDAVYSRRP